MKSMIEAARNDRLAIADLMLRSQGGTTCKYLDNNSQLPPDITHVVVDESNIRNVTALTRAFEGLPQPRIVTSKWVTDCLENKSLLDERLYEPRAQTAPMLRKISQMLSL
ncbi:DNA ligase (ATP) [Umbelopsis sp. WA50703]